MNENSQLKLVIVLEYTIYSQQKPRQFLSPLLLTLIYLTFFCSLYLEFLCRTSKGATSASCSIAGSLVQSCWVYCLWRILHVLQMHMWVPLFCFFQQTPKNKAVGRLAKLNCPRCENSSIFYSPNERWWFCHYFKIISVHWSTSKWHKPQSLWSLQLNGTISISGSLLQSTKVSANLFALCLQVCLFSNGMCIKVHSSIILYCTE